MTTATGIRERVIGLTEPLLEQLGYELVDVEWMGGAREGVLRFYIDFPGGVGPDGAVVHIGIEDCARASRELSPDPLTTAVGPIKYEVVDRTSGKAVATFDDLYAAAITPDESAVVTLGKEGLHVVDLSSGKRTGSGLERTGNAVAVSADGRFIADICTELVELGPVNATIHKVDERVRIADLEPLARIYRGILERLLLPAP